MAVTIEDLFVAMAPLQFTAASRPAETGTPDIEPLTELEGAPAVLARRGDGGSGRILELGQ